MRKQNPHTRRGMVAFVIMSAVYEIIALSMYGMFVKIREVYSMQEDIAVTIGLSLLVLVGFGLFHAYFRNSSLSAIGFTLLIASICYQHYFLVNAFWSKANIQKADTNFLDVDRTYERIIMGENSVSTPVNYAPYSTIPSGLLKTSLGATVWNAFKATLSIVVAFSAMLGRAGPMEIFFLSIFGVLFYELNVQLITRFAYDFGGSMTIFVYGGSLGFFASWLMTNSRNRVFLGHERYKSSKIHTTFSLLGALFIWVLFPFLAQQSTIYNSTSDPLIYNATKYAATMNCVFALAASTVVSFVSSLIFSEKIVPREVIQGSISGGIAILSSAGWNMNPGAATIIGSVAGFLQVLYLNKLDKLINKRQLIDSSGCLGLYVFGGIMGGVWSAVFAELQTKSNVTKTVWVDSAFSLSLPTEAAKQIGVIGTSLAFGSLVGTLIGIILKFANKNNEDDQFEDSTYWTVHDDGISYPQKRQETYPRQRSQSQEQRNGTNLELTRRRVTIKQSRFRF